jgi:hypothetical protein
MAAGCRRFAWEALAGYRRTYPSCSEPGGTMGADENAEIIRRGYEAFNSADMETLTEIFDEGAVWHTPGCSSLAGDRGTFRVGLHHLLADDELVVGIQRNIEGWEHYRDLYAWDEFWS